MPSDNERQSFHLELSSTSAPLPALEPGTTLTVQRSDGFNPLILEVERIEVSVLRPGWVSQDVYGKLP